MTLPVPPGSVMITLKIARFDPENPDRYAASNGWQSFRVPCLPSDRLLNLLMYVKNYLDGTFTFRRSCAHGVCGSDAMRVNGVNRLACKVLMRDLLPKNPEKQLTVTIEPIRGLAVEKDLVVDMEPFFDAYRAVKPYLMTSGNAPTGSGYRARPTVPDTTTPPNASCVPAAPPVVRCSGTGAAISGRQQSSTPIGSSSTAVTRGCRAAGDPERGGRVWRCRTTFNCTDACPRGIEVARRSRRSSARCCSRGDDATPGAEEEPRHENPRGDDTAPGPRRNR